MNTPTWIAAGLIVAAVICIIVAIKRQTPWLSLLGAVLAFIGSWLAYFPGGGHK